MNRLRCNCRFMTPLPRLRRFCPPWASATDRACETLAQWDIDCKGHATASVNSSGPTARAAYPMYGCQELAKPLVPGEGFEPPTFGLQNRCTATVLTRHNYLI